MYECGILNPSVGSKKSGGTFLMVEVDERNLELNEKG